MSRLLEQLLIDVLNMSLTASVMILVVLLARFLLRRAPRIFSYALWAVVLFRLLCPFSFSAAFSLLGMLQNESAVGGQMTYIPENIGYQMEPTVHLPVPALSNTLNDSLPAGNPQGSVNPMQLLLWLGSWLWLLGILVMLLYGLLSFLQLRKYLKTATREQDNIYRCDAINTPFVCGIFRPRIYLPTGLGREEERYILLHEQTHIRRRDHLFRLLASLALCLHWFNPLVWLSFFLSEKDMEMSCDEAVIRRIGNDVKKQYSESLLSIASGRHRIRGIPLAFGETDTKNRIKNILRYRKPSRMLIGLTAALCLVLAAVLLANPSGNAEGSADSPSDDLLPIQESGNDLISDSVDILSTEDLSDGIFKDGTYLLYIQSISRSAMGIDRYVVSFPGDDSQDIDLPFLPFVDYCAFLVNQEMDTVRYEAVTFDDFADIVSSGLETGRVPCTVTLENSQITRAALDSSWYGYGISYQPFTRDTWYDDILSFPEMEGIDPLGTYYMPVRTEKADFAEARGVETIEIYTGNIGDGDSGLVLFKNENGDILYSEGAHTSRAGWSNLYVGELDGTAFLMRVHVEDRNTYGGYDYQVFRLGAYGQILQIAGSSFEFDDDRIPYDDDFFREWIDGMDSYLERCHLLLSTQEMEVRTDPVSDADRYNYENLRR